MNPFSWWHFEGWKSLLLAAAIFLGMELRGSCDEGIGIGSGLGKSLDTKGIKPGDKPVKPVEAKGAELEGIWHTAYRTHLTSENLFFEFIKKPDGSFRAVFDSPEGKVRVPFEFVKVEGKTAKILAFGLQTFLELNLNEDGRTALGQIHSQGKILPFRFVRIPKRPDFPRPQDPKKPFPYREEEVAVTNEKAKVRLSGTLTIPEGEGPHPAVFLVTGSGPDVRNVVGGGHEYFLVLADFLTRRGIAVLRVDDRGIGKSTGRFDQVTSEISSQDAETCVAFLKGRKEIDPKKIGLIGHSDGVQAASLLAARSSDIAFLVMLAGQGVTGEKLMLTQSEAGYRALGQNDALVEFQLQLQKDVLRIVKEQTDDSQADTQLRKLIKDFDAKLTDEYRKKLGVDRGFSVMQMAGSPTWLRFFATNDPSAAIRKVKCPVLALNGDKDLIVSAKENLPAIEGALREGGNTDYTIKLMPNLNHMMQTCEVGAPWEYLHIEETMSPKALELVADWIKDHVK